MIYLSKDGLFLKALCSFCNSLFHLKTGLFSRIYLTPGYAFLRLYVSVSVIITVPNGAWEPVSSLLTQP